MRYPCAAQNVCVVDHDKCVSIEIIKCDYSYIEPMVASHKRTSDVVQNTCNWAEQAWQALFQFKARLPRYEISIIKIRRSWERLIFIMGIHTGKTVSLYRSSPPPPTPTPWSWNWGKLWAVIPVLTAATDPPHRCISLHRRHMSAWRPSNRRQLECWFSNLPD